MPFWLLLPLFLLTGCSGSDTDDTDACDDSDSDGVCDADDPCPLDDPDDTDGDTVCDSDDPCPDDNPDDTDGDTVCDSDDPCPDDNPDDTDGDGICDSDDLCPDQHDSNDADGDGVANDCDVCEGGDDQVDTDLDGTPDACDECPISLAYLESWGHTSTHAWLPFNDLVTDASDHGHCTFTVADVLQPFTLTDLETLGADVLLVINPAAGGVEYTGDELAAIESYTLAGHGLYASYALEKSPHDNAVLASLFGVDESYLEDTVVSTSNTAVAVATGHALLTELISPFQWTSWSYTQELSAGWDVAIGSDTVIVAEPDTGPGAWIAYEAGGRRSVWVSTFPGYQATSDSTQVFYNSVVWAAGYQP
ncbi:MAG: hypothetical protein JRI25_15155 [Deltaproteobacteria bacterium]|nr:hypothetical protein [Deltaproteobacteria bacterium]MBW2255920.1 hypothetical protein [Deltaproteobacteria bacterium]